MRQLEPPGKAWLGTVTGQEAGPGQHQPRDGHEVALGGRSGPTPLAPSSLAKNKKTKKPKPSKQNMFKKTK